MKLNELQREVWNTAEEHGFHSDTTTFGDRISLMHSELSEALEEYRDGYPFNLIRWEHGKPEGIPIEFADVLIRLLDAAEQYGIDMDEAVRVKHEFNESRPFRHGRVNL